MGGERRADRTADQNRFSSGSASSIASQQASAMSFIVRPASALGERPYPGMSMAMQRYQVDKCAI